VRFESSHCRRCASVNGDYQALNQPRSRNLAVFGLFPIAGTRDNRRLSKFANVAIRGTRGSPLKIQRVRLARARHGDIFSERNIARARERERERERERGRYPYRMVIPQSAALPLGRLSALQCNARDDTKYPYSNKAGQKFRCKGKRLLRMPDKPRREL